jgi:hypothetical protein
MLDPGPDAEVVHGRSGVGLHAGPGWICCCTGSGGVCRSQLSRPLSGTRHGSSGDQEQTWPVVKDAADLGTWLAFEYAGQGLDPRWGRPLAACGWPAYPRSAGLWAAEFMAEHGVAVPPVRTVLTVHGVMQAPRQSRGGHQRQIRHGGWLIPYADRGLRRDRRNFRPGTHPASRRPTGAAPAASA